MQILIIENESLATKRLASLIKEVNNDIQITKSCDSVKNSIQWLEKNKVDLIFSDIQLGDGLCFDIFDAIQTVAPIIFVTAFERYAIKAFEVNSIDYILKPFESADVKRAIDKYYSLYKNEAPVVTPYLSETVLTDLKSVIQTNYKSRFFVNNRQSAQSIDIADISCFIYEDGVVILMTATGSKYIIQYTLETLENLLDPKSFFRINRKMIINYHFIDHIKLYSKTSIAITITGLDKTNPVMVSRRKTAYFRRWLDA